MLYISGFFSKIVSLKTSKLSDFFFKFILIFSNTQHIHNFLVFWDNEPEI